jgi:hypothetical protein
VGYDLHITRAAEWLDSTQAPIGRAEWNAFARHDDRLAEVSWVDMRDTGREPVYAVTTSEAHEFSLWWNRDQVSVKGHFTDRACQELAELAAALNANLVGDDGEHYAPASAQ